MALSELFANFLSPFLELFPRLVARPATNQWLVWDRWGRPTRVITGARLHFPLFSHMEYLPAHEVEIDCGIQKVSTADWVPLVINATARVKIVDPIQLRYEAGGSDDSLEFEEQPWVRVVGQICRAYTCGLVQGHNIGPVQDFLVESDNRDLEEQLYEYGVELVAFKVEDIQKVLGISVT